MPTQRMLGAFSRLSIVPGRLDLEPLLPCLPLFSRSRRNAATDKPVSIVTGRPWAPKSFHLEAAVETSRTQQTIPFAERQHPKDGIMSKSTTTDRPQSNRTRARRRRDLVSVIAVLAILAGTTTACGDGSDERSTSLSSLPEARPLSKEVTGLVDEARKEGGELFLTWGQFNQPELLNAWSKDFNRIYDLSLNIINTPVTSHRENLQTAISEFKAGRRASTDVLLSTPGNAFAASNAGIAQKYDWKQLDGNVAAALQKDPAAVDLNGAAVPFYTALFGAMYNRDRVAEKDLPNNLRDFPTLPKKIVLGGADIASNMHLLADDRLFGKDLLPWFKDSWAPRVDGFANCSDVAPLTTGQFDVYALSCGKHFADLANASGARLGYKILHDAPILSFGEALPMVHASHPATARLFVDYLLGASAQEILRNVTKVDLHLLDGSIAEGEVTALKKQGIEFVVANADYLIEHPEFEKEILPKLVDILARR